MKSVFFLIAILTATTTRVLGQNSELNKKQIQSIQKLVNSFRENARTKIVDLIDYPLRREYPLKDVKDKKDFLQRFDDIFDSEFVERVAKSKISDWSAVGWRGIMFDDGTLWIDEDGKITSVNYQSPSEKQQLAHTIQADKNGLPKSLQNFKKPLYSLSTKNYKIRIDETSEGVYRYAAWKIKNQKSEPDLIIKNGVLEFQGSGGNHTITFENEGYTYTITINVLGSADTPDATLEVSKQEKTLLTESGKIKRN